MDDKLKYPGCSNTEFEAVHDIQANSDYELVSMHYFSCITAIGVIDKKDCCYTKEKFQ